MIDGVPSATGNSYLIKGGSSFPATYAEFLAQIKAGTLPLDILFNAAGWTAVGTELSKANLLDDTVAAALKTMAGLSSNPATPNAAFSAIAAAVSAGAKIATGSYIGNGLYGSANPCSLTFPFVPSVIFVVSQSSIRLMGSDTRMDWAMSLSGLAATYSACKFGYRCNQYTTNYAKLVEKTFFWYTNDADASGAAASCQFNNSGTKYDYVVFG